MYRVRTLNAAAHDLSQLDKPVGRRVVKRLSWLVENLDEIKPDALTGDPAGFYKFRVGDYRVLYEILREEQLIVVHAIGHHREIY